MPDERLKLSTEIEKILGIDSYRQTVRAMSSATNLATELMKMNDNSVAAGILKWIEKEELIRSIIGPTLATHHSFLLQDAALQLRNQNNFVVSSAMDALSARFHAPDRTELEGLFANFSMNQFSQLADRLAPLETLKRSLEAMKTPWLDMDNKMLSLTGWAELQGIGQALNSLPTFDETLSSALRKNLGDWRDSIVWPPEIFTDPVARTNFYIDRGFDPILTNFPRPAFEESLDIAGLRSEVADETTDLELDSDKRDGNEEQGFDRTNNAHGRLHRLESRLRKFIHEQMTSQFGPNWPENRLPNGVYESWCDKKQKAENAGAQERLLIEYADFTDYERIICRTDNWKEVFARVFNRTESVRESFQRLYPIRLDTMHARLITRDDELFLYVETKRLLIAIKRRPRTS